jgi:hypothetical protein
MRQINTIFENFNSRPVLRKLGFSFPSHANAVAGADELKIAALTFKVMVNTATVRFWSMAMHSETAPELFAGLLSRNADEADMCMRRVQKQADLFERVRLLSFDRDHPAWEDFVFWWETKSKTMHLFRCVMSCVHCLLIDSLHLTLDFIVTVT